MYASAIHKGPYGMNDPLDIKAPSPFMAVSSIIISMGMLAVGNGILFAFVPIKLAEAGFPPWVAGAIVTALAGGGLVGCLITGPMVRRVGHARVFATLTALNILGVLLIAAGIEPILWIVARGLYGVSAAGLFIVSQSWLNDACENNWRGKIIAMFYMIYVLAIGGGALLLRYISLDGPQAPLLAIFFAALAIFPVSLSRLPPPPPPASVTIAIRTVWRISPVGLVGLLAVGGLTMLVQGFAPIYASAVGYGKNDVALLMFLMQLGMIGVQYPLGTLSDRMDRRYVLIIAAIIVVVTASIAARMDTSTLLWMALVFAVWAGATEAIFSIASAHANDRGDPEYYVSMSSTLLVAWSVSGMVLPALTTALTPILGPEAFMFMAIAIAALYALFVLYRVTRREPPLEEDTEPHQQISAQAPYPADMLQQSSDDGT
jgi:MFS family permease